MADHDDDWDDLRQQFRRIAAREGCRTVAREVPVHHATVYRLISGDSAHPSRAVRAGIERLVRSRTKQTEETSQ